MGKDTVSPAPVEIDQTSLAWKIFNAFVTDEQFSATEEELMEYVTKDLKVNLDNLPTLLVENMPLMLIAFMNMWSGWHFKGEFFAGKFKKEHYFNRFQKFMVLKVHATIRSQFNAAVKGLTESGDGVGVKYKCAMKSTGRAVGPAGDRLNPDFSPYAISIQCPAQMLNTIVFSNVRDDVIMKQHLGSPWQDLSTTQLVNWPHIVVSFRTKDLYFVRRQATDFVRYLNFLPHECRKGSEDIIEKAEVTTIRGHPRACYTYRFLEEYIKEYIQALKTRNVSTEKLEEIHVILYQFLEDVRRINVKKCIATNTTILFRLSSVPFIRNKKLVKNIDKESDEARVGYCEIITPKVELALWHFNAKQKDTSHISFEFTDKIRENTSTEIDEFLPFIDYKCTFCKVEYGPKNSKALMLEHLKTEHKMEQHVRCTACKKQFDVLNLSACRWRHKCSPQPTTSTVTVL